METLNKLIQFLNVCVELMQTLQVYKNRERSVSNALLEGTRSQYC